MAKAVVIGLDIGTTQVRAAELVFGGGSGGRQTPTLTRYGEVALPLGAVRDGEVEDTAVVGAALRELWAQAKFTSRDVNIGVGNQRVVVRALELPWVPRQQINESLPFQVEELIPMSTDEALLDYYPTGESTGQTGRLLQGMLVAATKDTVQANVLAVLAAGLRPRLVDLSPFALQRALCRGELAEQTVALVEVGARITHVVIVDHGIPKFIRMLPFGGQNITDAVAVAMGISGLEAENLKREVGVGLASTVEDVASADAISSVVQPLIEAIRNTFVYYSGNNPGAGIDVAVLTGGGSQLLGFGQYLASATRLRVTTGDPLASLTIAKTARPDLLVPRSSVLAMPIGLAYGVAA
ncbi:type IV pilus assembly protein PilM [Pengzhenrongella sicca]|uniref:Type IV pilus assembly protein PilM n=1 Tax=Pengzhenrongella sicca TaxID=2819238 RepID=A0A8A4Z7X1_9MICO|nr:type IV pilus assembly protein PilM [Pengzhenrongella sicca]QTE28010.1 type IV pilus assembly protein PilM [Pengzhenrongella sicca]